MSTECIHRLSLSACVLCADKTDAARTLAELESQLMVRCDSILRELLGPVVTTFPATIYLTPGAPPSRRSPRLRRRCEAAVIGASRGAAGAAAGILEMIFLDSKSVPGFQFSVCWLARVGAMSRGVLTRPPPLQGVASGLQGTGGPE